MLYLLSLDNGANYHFDKGSNSELTIGRDDTNEFVIRDNCVSRYHCKLIFKKQKIWISDDRSTNGTLVNNIPIVTKLLNLEDEITIGERKYVLLSMEQLKTYIDEYYSKEKKIRRTINFSMFELCSKH